ncbi:hypothetical protein JTB14_026411 [Gonioctena quinquepunctata]|nr:hypothetical protein JTB14_026411 [Gonioctena quinquepunctata]
MILNGGLNFAYSCKFIQKGPLETADVVSQKKIGKETFNVCQTLPMKVKRNDQQPRVIQSEFLEIAK